MTVPWRKNSQDKKINDHCRLIGIRGSMAGNEILIRRMMSLQLDAVPRTIFDHFTPFGSISGPFWTFQNNFGTILRPLGPFFDNLRVSKPATERR